MYLVNYFSDTTPSLANLQESIISSISVFFFDCYPPIRLQQYKPTYPHLLFYSTQFAWNSIIDNQIVKFGPSHYYNKMKVLGCIGAGSFGKVFKVSIQDQVFAIKKISLQFDCEDDGWELQQVQKQAKILEQCLYHPNIVRYYYSCKQADCYLIAMEYISGRPMSDLQVPFTNQNAIVAFIIQVLLALRHLKKNQILHRDLKPSNIIVSQKGLFKLVDFGISKKLDKSNYAASCLGTPYYTAPQILWEEKYDYKVDIWSFGVILYEICHGKLPFIANSMEQLKKRIRQNHPTVRQDINDDIKLIIRGCLTKNPANRFTIQQILNLPLIRQQITNQTFSPVHIPSLQ